MALVAAYHFNCTKFGRKIKDRMLKERNVPEFVLFVAIVSPIFFPMYWVFALIVFLIFRYEEKHTINKMH